MNSCDIIINIISAIYIIFSYIYLILLFINRKFDKSNNIEHLSWYDKVKKINEKKG